MEAKIILAFILIAILGFGSGYMLGVRATINLGTKMLFRLMDYKKINIDIDETFLANGIAQYTKNFGGCLFLENKTITLDANLSNEIPK